MYRFPNNAPLDAAVMETCDTQFDRALLQIPHYRNHPEMLPFVGRGYANQPARVLLVGESHYVSNEERKNAAPRDVIADFETLDWYESPLCFADPDNVFCTDFGNYTTRHILNRFVTEPNFGGGGLLMFSNPLRAYYCTDEASEKPLKQLIHNFAFLNYYQRPAFAFGRTINGAPGEWSAELAARDNAVAAETLDAVIRAIKPDAVIMLSRKAYRAYTSANGAFCCNGRQNAPSLDDLPHPTSAWWNRLTKRGTCGRESFRAILTAAWGNPNN